MKTGKSENKESLINAEKVREILSYNAENGEFRWISKRSNRVNKNDVSGCVLPSGYISIGIKIGKNSYAFRAHRLAWLYVHGFWPSKSLDHIDRNKLNNSILNLREASGTENNRNRKKSANASSKYMGVYWCKLQKKWRARITVERKLCLMGYFDTEEEAALAYNKAALARDPKFNNLNAVIQPKSA